MRVDRHILHHAGHFAGFFTDIAAEDQYLSDRVGSLEIFTGDAFGNDHFVRAGQASVLISFQQIEVEEVKVVLFAVADICFAIQELVVLNDLFRIILAAYAGIILHAGQVAFHGCGISGGAAGPVVGQFPVLIEASFYTKDTVGAAMHVVVAVLECHVGQDQHGGGHTDCQAKYVDCAEAFLLRQAAECAIPIV